MAVIWFGRNVCLLVLITLVAISFTMSLHPVDCVMTAEESTLKMLSAKDVLLLTSATLADDHIRASIGQAYRDAKHKVKTLEKVSSSLYGIDAHEPISSPHERTVQEMVDALDRLPPLASLDPFLAQVLDKLHNSIKPMNKFMFKKVGLVLDLHKNLYNKEAKSTLDDCEKRTEATDRAFANLERALLDYRNKWKQTQVRPKQAEQKAVLVAVEGRIKTVKEHVAVLFDKEVAVENISTEQSYFWLKVSGAIAALVIIILLLGVVALCFILTEKRGMARSSPGTTNTMTDSSP